MELLLQRTSTACRRASSRPAARPTAPATARATAAAAAASSLGAHATGEPPAACLPAAAPARGLLRSAPASAAGLPSLRRAGAPAAVVSRSVPVLAGLRAELAPPLRVRAALTADAGLPRALELGLGPVFSPPGAACAAGAWASCSPLSRCMGSAPSVRRSAVLAELACACPRAQCYKHVLNLLAHCQQTWPSLYMLVEALQSSASESPAALLK